MELVLVRHLWGVQAGNGLETLLLEWREFGYRGIETPAFLLASFGVHPKSLRHHDFFWIPQVFSGVGHSHSVDDHLHSLEKQIEDCLEGSPLFFNAQSGSDAWSLSQAEEFYGRMIDYERALGIDICHETHRSRFLSNPWNTDAILNRFPGLKLTCDFSHWVCVAERLLQDCSQPLLNAAIHCWHIHARVGHEQGPQVPDPRAPEWADHLAAHECWWDQVWHSQHDRQLQRSTLTPEFGPRPYMQSLPFTKQPVADLAEICDWMARRQKQRYQASYPA